MFTDDLCIHFDRNLNTVLGFKLSEDRSNIDLYNSFSHLFIHTKCLIYMLSANIFSSVSSTDEVFLKSKNKIYYESSL